MPARSHPAARSWRSAWPRCCWGRSAIWRRRDVVRFFSFSTIEQSGVAAFAFGLGGAGATFAGLLHITLHTLAKASVFQVVGRAAQAKGSQDFPGRSAASC
ncbi:MAG: hypothetical protein WDN49_27995 [Acetobacteraceae bacterium]